MAISEKERLAEISVSLSQLDRQPRVRQFLCQAVKGGKLSHSYLFSGAEGSGRRQAALALAKAMVCEHHGCNKCEECVRVDRNSHPDVVVLAPESATGYLIGQIKQVISQMSLAPVRGRAKVYIFTQADRLKGTAANALLKTIEEPPEQVMFIFIAPSRESVLNTIVSRCQQVPFHTLSQQMAEREVERICGLAGPNVRVALAVAKTPEEAASYLLSGERRATRDRCVDFLRRVDMMDNWDVLVFAQRLGEAIQLPVDAIREEQESQDKVASEFLSSSAMKLMDKAHKRQLTQTQLSAIMEALNALESMLRDVLLLLLHTDLEITNEDAADVCDHIASYTTPQQIIQALKAIDDARYYIARMVDSHIVLEVMLIDIKEALCPSSYR